MSDLTGAELERRMLLSLIFSAAEWIDLVVNEWNYYVGGDEFPLSFLENARSVGWVPQTHPDDYEWPDGLANPHRQA